MVHGANIFATSLKGAAILFLTAAAAIGWESSTGAQVAVIDWTSAAQVRIASRIPFWLSGADRTLDAPVPLLSRPLAAQIVHETFSYKTAVTTREAQLKSIQILTHDASKLAPIVHGLALGRRLLDEQVLKSIWWSRSRNPLWPVGPVTAAALLDRIPNATERLSAVTFSPNLHIALNVSTPDTRLQIESPFAAFDTYAQTLDTELRVPSAPQLLLEALRTHWKWQAADSLHSSLLRALAADTELRSSAAVQGLWRTEEQSVDRILAAVTAAAKSCKSLCGRLTEGHELVRELLAAIAVAGARFPETAILTLLETLANPYPAPELSRRELERLLTVEAFRRHPNRWLALAGLAVGIGAATFLVSLAYQIAWLVNVGILGTVVNLVGLIYDTSSDLRRSRHQLRLENRKTD